MHGFKCRKCGQLGSVQLKEISNGHGGTYSYYYVAHPAGPHRVTWCYLGKKAPERDGQ